jgi:hypothetical protein
MLKREDFEAVLGSIDRSKSIPTRLIELGIDGEELRQWLLEELGDFSNVAMFGAGLEFGMHLERKANEVHT